MSFLHLYYHVKPVIPRWARVKVRRWVVRRQATVSRDRWPIDTRAARAPEGWDGWPGGKKFALVLTHDVETAMGYRHCLKLADIDAEHGFRSSFHFVPERYAVSPELRRGLRDRGFEVALHGLKHDGKLFRSRAIFEARMKRINQYAREWGVRGFRAPLMIRDLDWIHGLEIDYDSSTFDTDPFEPQPEGVQTIFPFLVRRDLQSTGYVEIPYTLPQDSTLFLFKQEQTIDIWKRKLDWVAEQGGMALLLTHPDYMSFDGEQPAPDQYPSDYYHEFLQYIRNRYADAYWHCLPEEMADFWRANYSNYEISSPARTVWIDLDNSPHVPFFEPIIKELHRRGYRVLLTARDAFQVRELTERYSLSCHVVGRHHGKNRIRKLLGLMWRSCQLAPLIARARPVAAISHGARSQMILARILGIRSILIDDYEHSQYLPFFGPDRLITPDVIREHSVSIDASHVRTYHGIKEDVYVPGFEPDPAIRDELRLLDEDLVVTVRPPADEAHYHRAESDVLFGEVMDHLMNVPHIRVVLLPRTPRQGERIVARWPAAIADRRIVIPARAVDGLNLIWHSDLVISGGGTMNREAAALGVPVYSIFRGPIGAVDQELARENRLVLIEQVADIADKIRLERRSRGETPLKSDHVLRRVVDAIVEFVGPTAEAAVSSPVEQQTPEPEESSP